MDTELASLSPGRRSLTPVFLAAEAGVLGSLGIGQILNRCATQPHYQVLSKTRGRAVTQQ